MLFLLAVLCLSCSQVFGATEADLRRNIFAGYDKLVRPIRDVSKNITVAAAITPLFVNELNEKDSVLSMGTFLVMKWHDDFLIWDPKEYSNITHIQVPQTEVWKPDIALYTTADEESLFPKADTRVLIYPDGSVLWVPMFTVRSRCPLPHMRKNKDYVVCNIKFGSWTYSGPRMDVVLYKEKVDMSDFQNVNPNWKVVDFKADREEKFYPCCPEPYPSLNFNVTLKRRMDFPYTTEPIPYSTLV